MKYRSGWIKCVALLGGAVLATGAMAAPTIWAVDSGQKLGKIDVATGAVSGVVSTGLTLTDIAFDPLGGLWGITFQQLFSINPATGASTLVGTLSAPENLNALVFGTDGTLWAAGTRLYKVSTTTGVATSVGNGGTTYASAGDLAFVNGQLFLSTTANRLVRLNTTNGAATTVGNFGVTDVYGLATPDHSTMYGIRGTQVFSVNPLTGAASNFVSYAGQGLNIAYGSAFQSEAAPVPEPQTYAMLLAGLGIVGLMARRSRKTA